MIYDDKIVLSQHDKLADLVHQYATLQSQLVDVKNDVYTHMYLDMQMCTLQPKIMYELMVAYGYIGCTEIEIDD